MFPMRALVVLAFAYFVMGTASFSIIGLVPGLSRDLGVSAAAVATLVTVYALVFAFAAPLSQILFGNRPRLRILQTGLGLTAIGMAAGALAPDHATLTASRVVLALGGAMVGPTASAIATGIAAPAQRGRALAIVFGGMSVATVLGVPLSALAGDLVGWRWVFGLLALVAALTLGGVGLSVRDGGTGGALRLRDLGAIAAAAPKGLAFATTFVQMAAQFVTYTLIGPYLVETVGIGGDAVPAMLMVFGVGGVLGNILAGPATDRFGAVPTITASLLGIGGAFALLALLPGLAWLGIAAFVVWSVCGFLFQTPQQKRIAELDPERRGLMLALNAASLYLGVSAGSAIGSAVYAASGPALLPLASLAALLLAAGLFALSVRAARA